jgi:hypothetical protein
MERTCWSRILSSTRSAKYPVRTFGRSLPARTGSVGDSAGLPGVLADTGRRSGLHSRHTRPIRESDGSGWRERAGFRPKHRSGPRGVLGGAEQATRKPTSKLRKPGAFLLRLAARQLLALTTQAPPRKTRLPPALPTISSNPLSLSPHLSWHHCKTLPCISNSPQSFGRSDPTGRERLLEFTKYQAYFGSRSSPSPMDQPVTLPARQAYSHSASVGNR